MASGHGTLIRDEAVCALWARVRYDRDKTGRPIAVADAWIAATALYLDAPLVTHNARDFDQIKNLEVYTAGARNAMG